jgi:ABC-2 type transport system ATP-binding protein
MSILVHQITKNYGKQKALDSVTFNIKNGEIVGLLGPNGAGKSTLMKILSCFIPKSSGDAKVCDFDVLEQSIDVRKNVGYLPENNPLYHEMYVREFLLFIAGIHKLGNKKKSRVEEMIEITGLQQEQKKKIGALSKGYRQRVGLAQAMMHSPQVLILDEPTSGLDPNQIIEIRTLIKKIGTEKTVMLSTHIMQEVEAVCNRAIIINKGKIVADDLTENLHRLLINKNIVTVEFNKQVAPALLKKIDGIINAIHRKDNVWELHAGNNDDVRSNIFNFAVQNNLTVLSMKKEDNSMEDVFHQLTRE